MNPIDDWPLRCVANPQLPAAAFCTVCRQPFSGKFLGVRDDGRAVCHGCARRDDIPLNGAPHSEGQHADPLLQQGWFRASAAVVATPHISLARDDASSPWPAIAFGFVATLFGYALTLGWNIVLYPALFVAEVSANAEALGFSGERTALTWLAWLGTPIAAGLRLFVGTIILHVCLLVPARDARVASTARIFGLSSVALLLCAIPIVGSYLAMVVWISTVLAWLRARYRIRTFMALFVILPSVFALTAMGPLPYTPTPGG